jgi:hypothetical protein
MNDTAKQKTVNGEPYNYCKDFTVLTPAEKRVVLKTAKDFLKLQRENALLINVPTPSMENCPSRRSSMA